MPDHFRLCRADLILLSEILFQSLSARSPILFHPRYAEVDNFSLRYQEAVRQTDLAASDLPVPAIPEVIADSHKVIVVRLEVIEHDPLSNPIDENGRAFHYHILARI